MSRKQKLGKFTFPIVAPAREYRCKLPVKELQ